MEKISFKLSFSNSRLSKKTFSLFCSYLHLDGAHQNQSTLKFGMTHAVMSVQLNGRQSRLYSASSTS